MANQVQLHCICMFKWGSQAGEGDQGQVLAVAAAGVLVAEIAVADIVDEFVFRGDGGWGTVVGDQPLRRVAEGSLRSW